MDRLTEMKNKKIENEETIKRLERFLRESPTYQEFGGFLLKNRMGILSDFILIPNISEDKNHSYQMPRESKNLAEKYSNSRRMNIEAEWHSHPEPCVLSSIDCKGSVSWESNYSVMISPLNISWKSEFIWYSHKGTKPEKIEFV